MTRNVSLLLILATLVLISLLDDFFEKKDDGKDIDDERLSRLHKILENLESYEIDHISNKSSFSLNGGLWYSNLRGSFGYNYESVNRYVASLKRFRVSRPIEVNSADMEGFGLAEDAFAIRVKGQKEEEVIKIGHRSLIGFYRYAKLESDSKIYLINEGVGMALVKSKDFFREKRLISVSLSQMSSISIVIESKEFLDFRKDNKGNWKIRGHSEPLDLERFVEFYNNIAGIPITEFVPDHEAKPWHLEKREDELMTISLTFINKSFEKITVVKNSDVVFAQSSRSPGVKIISLAGVNLDRNLDYFVKKYSFDPGKSALSSNPRNKEL